MRLPAVRSVCLVIGLVLAPGLTRSFAPAQTIQGILLERETQALIESGTVVMLRENGDTVALALSDENGLFSLTGPEEGSYRIVARALGYTPGGAGPFELEEDALRVVQLALVPAPIPIEGIDVETTPIVITDDLLLAVRVHARSVARPSARRHLAIPAPSSKVDGARGMGPRAFVPLARRPE